MKLAEERREYEDAVQEGSSLCFSFALRRNTEVSQEHVQQRDERAHSFEIENVIEKTRETNIITVNKYYHCQAKQMPD